MHEESSNVEWYTYCTSSRLVFEVQLFNYTAMPPRIMDRQDLSMNMNDSDLRNGQPRLRAREKILGKGIGSIILLSVDSRAIFYCIRSGDITQ